MPPFGENLRREREMRGVSLEEISAGTKISVRFLQAIEAEQFFTLPGGMFTRSFIRAYAHYLGLDEERIMAEYQLVAQPKADVDLHRLTVTRPVPSREGSRSPLLALLLAVILLSGGYALFRYSRRVAETPASVSNRVSTPAVQPSTPAPRPPSVPVEPTPGPATGARAGSPALPAAGTIDSEGGLVLQIAATERAWVAVDADGQTKLQRILNPNEIETLKAKDSFDVTTGNAQGIILTLNGETLNPLGRRGEVKSIRLTRDDLRNPAP